MSDLRDKLLGPAPERGTKTYVVPEWYPTPQMGYQFSHFAFAVAVVFGAVVFGYHPWQGALIVLGWATVKEFIFDFVVERDTVVGSILDFVFYVFVGTPVALLLCWLSTLRN